MDKNKLDETISEMVDLGWDRKHLHDRQKNYPTIPILADDLAEFLGFENREDLAAWAERNPEIWGNSHGGLMFKSADAWGGIGKNADAQTIIDHLRGVLARLDRLEAAG